MRRVLAILAALVMSLAVPGASAAEVQTMEVASPGYSYTTSVCPVAVDEFRLARVEAANGVFTYALEMGGTDEAGLPWLVAASFASVAGTGAGVWTGAGCGAMVDAVTVTVTTFDCPNGIAAVKVEALGFFHEVEANGRASCTTLPDDLL